MRLTHWCGRVFKSGAHMSSKSANLENVLNFDIIFNDGPGEVSGWEYHIIVKYDSPSRCNSSRPQFHFTLLLIKIIWNMQAEVFCKAAKNGDLAQVRDSIGAGVSLNCTNQVRNRLCRNSYDHDYYHVTSSYLYLSLSFLFLSNNLSLMSILSHYHLLSVSPLSSFQSLTLAPSHLSFVFSLHMWNWSPLFFSIPLW